MPKKFPAEFTRAELAYAILVWIEHTYKPAGDASDPSASSPPVEFELAFTAVPKNTETGGYTVMSAGSLPLSLLPESRERTLPAP